MRTASRQSSSCTEAQRAQPKGEALGRAQTLELLPRAICRGQNPGMACQAGYQAAIFWPSCACASRHHLLSDGLLELLMLTAESHQTNSHFSCGDLGPVRGSESELAQCWRHW